MLRYDHSKTILSGLLGPHFLIDANTKKPIKDAYDELMYGSTVVNFPQPKISAKEGATEKEEEFELTYNITGSQSYYSTKVTPRADFPKLIHQARYLIVWDGIEYICQAYMDADEYNALKPTDELGKQKIYIGNPTIYSSPGIDSYDSNVPFVIHTTVSATQFTIYTDDLTKDKHYFRFYYTPDPSIYIGLSSQDPGPDGTLFLEPGKEADENGRPLQDSTTYPEYLRVRINIPSRFDKQTPLLGQAEINEETGFAEVTNQDLILFPESIGDAGSGWGHITHFGLFYGTHDDPKYQVPFLWGAIHGVDDEGNETDGVDIKFQEVPVIRKAGLTISLQ